MGDESFRLLADACTGEECTGDVCTAVVCMADGCTSVCIVTVLGAESIRG